MANNHFLTINTKFRPFSYQEMLAPIADYQKAYDTQLEALDTLAEKSEFAGSHLTNPKDAALKNQYESYKKDLDIAMNDIYQNGLNSNSRRNLMKLKKQYTKSISPIEEAYAKYDKTQQDMAQLALTHPELVVEGSGLSVSDFMGGKTPKPTVVDMNESAKSASDMAASYAERLRRESGWYNSGIDGIMSKRTSVGLTDAEFERAMFELENTDDVSRLSANAKSIKEIYDTVSEKMGVSSLKDAPNQNKVNAAILSGIRKGLQYKESIQNQAIPGYMTKEQKEAHDLNIERNKTALAIQRFPYEFDDEGNVIGFSPEYLEAEAEKHPEDNKPSGGSDKPKSSPAGGGSSRVAALPESITMRIVNGKNSAKKSLWGVQAFDSKLSPSRGIPTSFDRIVNDIAALQDRFPGIKVNATELENKLRQLNIFDSLSQHQLYISVNKDGDVDLNIFKNEVAMPVGSGAVKQQTDPGIDPPLPVKETQTPVDSTAVTDSTRVQNQIPAKYPTAGATKKSNIQVGNTNLPTE